MSAAVSSDASSAVLSIAQADQIATIMQGMAAPARVRVLAELQRQPRTVSELGASLEMTQTTLSNHLRVLRILGLVTTQRDGRFVRYSLHDAHVAELLSATLSHAAHVSMSGGIAASS